MADNNLNDEPLGLGDLAYTDYSDLLTALDKDLQVDLTQQQQPLSWGTGQFIGNGTAAVTFNLSLGRLATPSCVIAIPYGWVGGMSITSVSASIASLTALIQPGSTFTNAAPYSFMFLVLA